MKRRQPWFAMWLLAAATAASCTGAPEADGLAGRVFGPTPHSVRFPPVTPAGDLVAYVQVLRDGRKKVAVSQPYAVLMNRLGENGRFYVHDNVRKRVRFTDDFDVFCAWVEALPEGAGIQRIEKCSVPFSHGLPAARRKQLRAAMERRNQNWIPCPTNDLGYWAECTCEARQLLFPDGKAF